MLGKHVGWFDHRDNAPGQLSTVLASDAQIINGVSAEGMATQMEATCALLCGVTLGFVFEWREALVCLGCVPFMLVSTVIQVKFQKNLSQSSDKASKEANVLAGDAILNYRTVASFGNEE
jgi:ABC-type transport system involved in Fe-S cluster assembly fused permease/ATPase subunit